MGGMKGIHYWGLQTLRKKSCLTRLVIMPEVGMEGSKSTGTVQNWYAFSPGSYCRGQVESESQITVGVK